MTRSTEDERVLSFVMIKVFSKVDTRVTVREMFISLFKVEGVRVNSQLSPLHIFIGRCKQFVLDKKWLCHL